MTCSFSKLGSERQCDTRTHRWNSSVVQIKCEMGVHMALHIRVIYRYAPDCE